MTRYYDKNGVELSEVAQADIDNTASIGKYYWHTDKTLWIIVAKGAYADIAAARTGLGTTRLVYQLATPVLSDFTPQQIDGDAGDTIMWLPYIQETKIYSSGISISDTSLPIKSLIKVVKINEVTQERTSIDISTCTVAPDGLSFTSTVLANGDTVEFVYEYDSALTTIPTLEVIYANNLKAQVNNNTAGVQLNSKAINELSDFAVAYLINLEARIVVLESA